MFRPIVFSQCILISFVINTLIPLLVLLHSELGVSGHHGRMKSLKKPITSCLPQRLAVCPCDTLLCPGDFILILEGSADFEDYHRGKKMFLREWHSYSTSFSFLFYPVDAESRIMVYSLWYYFLKVGNSMDLVVSLRLWFCPLLNSIPLFALPLRILLFQEDEVRDEEHETSPPSSPRTSSNNAAAGNEPENVKA